MNNQCRISMEELAYDRRTSLQDDEYCQMVRDEEIRMADDLIVDINSDETQEAIMRCPDEYRDVVDLFCGEVDLEAMTDRQKNYHLRQVKRLFTAIETKLRASIHEDAQQKVDDRLR